MAEVKRTNGGVVIAPISAEERDYEYREFAFATFNRMILPGMRDQLQHHFDKYGGQRLDDGNWLKVIIEEEGEAVNEINKLNYDAAMLEIEQVIACWARMYIELRRMELGIADEERSLYTRAV